MSSERREQWQQRYLLSAEQAPEPSGVLAEHLYLLPKQGRALDLACGRGGNALTLARQGLDVHAWDYAPAAIEALQKQSEVEGQRLECMVRDVEQSPPEPNSFDVIVVSYFLAREIVPSLVAALRPDGLVFYETYILDRVSEQGPENPSFRLRNNELLRLFSGLRVLSYTEHGSVGDPSRGLRNVARLVATRTRTQD